MSIDKATGLSFHQFVTLIDSLFKNFRRD